MPITDVSLLHPTMRARSLDLEARVSAAGLPIRRFEGWRDPARQADLWAFGRVSGVGVPGRHKTFEQSWQSAHQWGLAEDWVWFYGPGWSWAPPPGRTWDTFHALATGAGLQFLSFEEPHVQVPGVSGRKILAGDHSLIAGGDDAWEANLERAAATWGPLPRKDRYGVEQPGVPALFAGRPAIPVPPGMVYDDERGLCLVAGDEAAPDVPAAG